MGYAAMSDILSSCHRACRLFHQTQVAWGILPPCRSGDEWLVGKLLGCSSRRALLYLACRRIKDGEFHGFDVDLYSGQ